MKRLTALLLAVLLLSGCVGKPATPTTTEATTVPVTTEATTEVTTEPTTEPATVPATEATTVPVTTEPAPVLHSGLREDGTFTEGTWFIGDSMTCNLMVAYLTPKGLIGDANYTGKYGAQITAFFDGTVMNRTTGNFCVFRPEHQGMTYEQVGLELGESATAIYIMFGTNFTDEGYTETYLRLVDYLLATCPNATIHMQLIPWGRGVHYDTVNGWIREIHAHYEQSGEQRVLLLDTHTAIGRSPLSDTDQVHLSNTGNRKWYEAILQHAADHNLVP